MRHCPYLTNLQWSDLAFELPVHPSRLVLRHNQHLQYGYTPAAGETLEAALRKMEAYCKTHAKGNPKITGPIKVVEHTRLNGAPLWVKLRMWTVAGRDEEGAVDA
jgi:hypothetical protein